MFRSARIKLTLAYVIIITVVTVIFSSVVYVNVNRFTQRALQMHERRVETRLREFPGGPMGLPDRFQAPFTQEAIAQVRRNTILLLVTANTTIIMLSGVFGYWFAGITLKPIEEMTKKQKKFVADAAHELKTPLTAIKTQLEVELRNKKFNLPKAKKLIGSTIEDVDSLTLLTNSLLKQSKYQDHKVQKEYETFNLKDLVEKATEKFRDKLSAKNIKIKVEVPDIKIKASKNSANELLTILLDNAIKFNKDGGSINITADKTAKEVEIKITDTGIGIDEEDVPNVFNRFFKADISRTKVEHDGFGLGLSIAKDIVESHGGHIYVESEKDKGSTFTVLLPQKT